MAKILKCPHCQQVMDVTTVSPGSTVRCPDCGEMAAVPASATSVAVKSVSTPIPASPPPAPPASSRDRGTRIRERRSSGTLPVPQPQTSSHGGLFVGLSIGAFAVVAVILAFTLKEKPEEPPLRNGLSGPREALTFRPNLPPSSEKPIKLSESRSDDAKPVMLSRPTETVDNANWDQIMSQLRPGGGFEFPDRPEGVAFLKVKGFGKAAYPHLIKYIDDEEPAIAIAAVAVLNELTGRSSPLPKGINKAKIKAEWQAWLEKGETARPDTSK